MSGSVIDNEKDINEEEVMVDEDAKMVEAKESVRTLFQEVMGGTNLTEKKLTKLTETLEAMMLPEGGRRRSSKKRGTQRKQKRRQRRGSRRAY